MGLGQVRQYKTSRGLSVGAINREFAAHECRLRDLG